MWKQLLKRIRPEGRKAELDEELTSHLRMAAADHLARGVSAEEAHARAVRELGNAALVADVTRDAWGWVLLERLLQDLRYAVRQLRRAPGFTITAILTLGLGIGVNAAMFSVVDQTLLRRLPYPDARQLLLMRSANQKGETSWTSYADLNEWQKRSRSFLSLAGYQSGAASMQVAGSEQPVSQTSVSASFFTTLGVMPAMGRGFRQEEEQQGKGSVVVLSDALWRGSFHADPAILGRTVQLYDSARAANNSNGSGGEAETYTVVGVMPRGFVFPADDHAPQLWIPVALGASAMRRDYEAPSFLVLGRLRPGISPDTARNELSAIQKQNARAWHSVMATEQAPSQVLATRYKDTLIQDARPALLALVGAVLAVWLIACANVANLMLARATSRQREFAVRGTLGAGRLRLLRQLLTESLVLSLAGTAVGLALAQIVLRAFEHLLTARLNLTGHLTPSLPVLLALLALSIVTALAFGLAPGWLATRTPIEQALRQGSIHAGGSRSRHALQHFLVAGEIALSLVLLVACGLLLRTVFALRSVPLGFRTDHVLMTSPELPPYKYRNVDINQRVWRPLVERIRTLHGVQAASLTTVVPLSHDFDVTLSFYRDGGNDKNTQAKDRIVAAMRASGPELQKVFGFRMRRGRFFNQQDTPDSQPVAVVNQTFARLWDPPDGAHMVGKEVVKLGKNRPVRIIGVMDDFRQTNIDAPPNPEFEFCAPQLRSGDSFYQATLQAHVELAIRTAGDPNAMIADVRSAMRALNPDLATARFSTMDQVVEDSMGSQLLAAHLLETFAGTALLVALTGLYGLLAYLVTQRSREMGVRIALGARRADIVALVMRQAAWMLLVGTAAGIAMAWFAGRAVTSFLYGVKPHDGLTIAAVSALLLAGGLLAAWLPARRAASVEPMQALRSE